MLFLDPSEVRDDTRIILGDLAYSIIPGLEEMTGADLLISALNAPCSSEQLIRFHLRNKAIMVQRKHRLDLVSSLGDRLKTSITKMRKLTSRPAQCSLLFIGVLTCDHNGNAQIDGQDANRPYWAVYAGMDTWIKYGGVVEPPLCRATLIPDWVRMKTRHIAETLSIPVKEFMPTADAIYEIDPTDPLQELVMVKDWRQTVMCCPGWGIKKVNAMHEIMLSYGVPQTLQSAIILMTSKEALGIPGVGKSLIEKACKWYGVNVPKEL